MSLERGTRVGPYEILAVVGAGGMGEVYRARDTKLGRQVAIKILQTRLAGDREHLRRFEQEARSASSLNHPNIITIYEVGEIETTPYIAMEFIEGKRLRDLLAAGPLPLKKTLEISCAVADGLAAAHSRGIIHRDLKPENVMITNEGFVKIVDFGLAKLIETVPESNVVTANPAEHTRPGAMMGTPGYMSPEQA
ncbi:MAG TPA: serine/threonine-protein kinase, partial [Thermoanaerobaculia bacterium]